ncbi:MAG: BREX-3 system phosphatase PglZ [Candidatus Aminicenantes bacterium]|nr:MAG: BREX-3 system phosphatase PglZ [Candidatus Aminicenantes bacterium]
MSHWYDAILKEFIPDITPITLTADPDGLLSEENLQQRIRDRGFQFLNYEDPVAFRFEYESRFRDKWLQGEQTELVVVLRAEPAALDSLPYDLLQKGRKLCFSLTNLFPGLSCPVVGTLEREDLETLFNAQKSHNPGKLGENGTKEFILRHIFEIAPELIKDPKDLLRALLRIHYSGRRIPDSINERFVRILRQNDIFDNWPLENIIPNREDFFAFLQERWSLYLDCLAADKENEFKKPDYKNNIPLKYPGPRILPFEHDDIRIYMDNLFNEGFLRSITHEQADLLNKTWAGIGVCINQELENKRRLEGLIETIKTSIPTATSRHIHWLQFAFRWAELNALVFGIPDLLPKDQKPIVEELRSKIAETFASWIKKRFAGLVSLPPLPPVMLHHIPRFMARQIPGSKQNKAALILMDGMSLDQWLVLKKSLLTQLPGIEYYENGVFSWVPGITSVSRQALFAGKPPVYFPSSINSTGRDAAQWTNFWIDQGFKKDEVIYQKKIDEENIGQLDEMLSNPRVRTAGLVIDKIDSIMHGMQLGSAGMHNQVNQWAKQGFMAALINLLLEHRYSIYLTSDHGNIEAVVCGRPSEGVIADLRGERVRIYPDELLRKKISIDFPGALAWPTIGLPENYLPLLAPHGSAFVKKNQRLVCHGGISIEEVIVPLVKIQGRET